MEKSVVTPDQYPLTLNALVSACNQKSSRDPVMSLEQGLVQRTVRNLENKHLVRTEENFKSRVEKYTQRFSNTQFSEFQFDAGEFSIVCLLLLRGPQTPGELRSRSGRLHSFSDNAEVIESATRLIDREDDGEPLLVKLPRTPGRKDAEYMHLFAGPIDIEAHAASAAAAQQIQRSDSPSVSERLSALEAEVAEIRKLLNQ